MYKLAAEGVTAHGIAAKMNELGHTTKKGCEFMPCNIHGVLTNPIYAGYRSRPAKEPGRPLEEGPQTEIVAREIWHTVNARYRRGSGKRGAPRKYPLSGLIVCGECGERYVVASGTASGPDKTFEPNYRCSGRYYKQGCENSQGATISKTHWVVLGWLESLRPSDLRAALGDAEEPTHPRDHEAEIAALKESQARLIDAIAGGPVPGQMMDKIREIEGEISQVYADLAEDQQSTKIDVGQAIKNTIDKGEIGNEIRDLITSITVPPDKKDPWIIESIFGTSAVKVPRCFTPEWRATGSG